MRAKLLDAFARPSQPALFVLIFISVFMLVANSLFLKDSPNHETHLPTPKLCDPYATPAGILDKSTGAWTVISSLAAEASCNATDNVQILMDAQASNNSLPPHLANKIVLFIGDSFERNIVSELCEKANVQPFGILLNGTFVENPIFGDTRICVIRGGESVFVVINVFHFGIVGDFSRFPMDGFHWEKGYSPLKISERIQWIPHLLLSAAGHAFPELCIAANQTCPSPVFRKDRVENTRLEDWTPEILDLEKNHIWYPKPDMIVSQSLTWDLAKFTRCTNNDFIPLMEEWVPKFRNYIIKTVRSTFGGVVKNQVSTNGEIVPRFYTRTLPLPKKGSRFTNQFFSSINSVNQLVRKGIFKDGNASAEWGVLDWDLLVNGVDIHTEDPEHPNKFGNIAYMQLVLSRLNLLYQAEKKQ
ncbi:UNVERIFIED_CONTAM: hypothetical protein HDU68_000839 [Siphonaria sp. JEL0065]|nr:hypothetical protein HDU68_000839 [Siphonaria sp. JEL0065]